MTIEIDANSLDFTLEDSLKTESKILLGVKMFANELLKPTTENNQTCENGLEVLYNILYDEYGKRVTKKWIVYFVILKKSSNGRSFETLTEGLYSFGVKNVKGSSN